MKRNFINKAIIIILIGVMPVLTGCVTTNGGQNDLSTDTFVQKTLAAYKVQ